MKKTLFLVIIIIITNSLIAQTDEYYKKGAAFITGGGGMLSTKAKGEDNKFRQIYLSPSAAYFLGNNFALGLKMEYRAEKQTQISNDSVIGKANAVSAGVFSRYYFTPRNRFSVFGNMEAMVTKFTAEKNFGTVPGSNITGFDLSCSPGFNYFISKKLSLEALLGGLTFSRVGNDEMDGNYTNSFEMNFDLSKIYFGINYRLGK